MPVKDYEGMMIQMKDDTLVIDDITQYETEMLIDIYKPDILCAGIKEKYSIQKTGTPCLQLHSYDYGGPFAGFKGAINFYKTVDRMVGAEFWKHIQAPWAKVGKPVLEASFNAE
jgi:nitrogenase molybdenum-iron protein alpha chain